MKHFLLLVLIMFSSRQLLLAQAPVNDECAGAISVTLSAVGSSCTQAVDANTANATRSLPNPSCTSSLNDDDIWYSFQATGSGIVLRVFDATYNVSGQTAQVGFALYGTACPVTTATLACSNFITAGAGYTAITGLIPGNTYYLRFWSASATEFASFRFCVQETNAPANDECENATPVDTEPEGTFCNAVYHASTAGASRSLPNPSCTNFNDDDIWYSFTAGANGVRLNFSNALQVLSGGNANLGYALHEAPCGGSLVSCSANIGVSGGSELIGGLVPGNTYLLRLFTYSAANTYANFDFCLVDETIVVNDECTGAIELTVTNGFASELKQGSLLSATTSAGFGSPACTPPSSSDDVWFKAVVPASGNIAIQTSAAVSRINDLVMEAYSGDCNTLSFILCADNGNPNTAPSNGHPLISLTGRVPGETIFLRVMGKGSINNGPFVIGAWDPSLLPEVSGGGDCIATNNINLNAANGNQYTWIPVFDLAGNIVAECYAGGNSPGLISSQLFVNSSGAVRIKDGKYYLDRHFFFAPADTVPVKLRLYIKGAELAALQSADPAIIDMHHLQVVITSNNCNEPRNIPAAIVYPDTARLYKSDFYIEFETAAFGSFYIERQETVVPVSLTNYHATCNADRVLVSWTTQSEVNNDFFTIMRSEDGSHFKAVGTLAAKGHASGASYTFEDNNLTAGENWYRLVQTDQDGREQRYPVIKVACMPMQMVNIYPNPANTIIYIITPGTPLAQVNLFSADGHLLKQQRIANSSLISHLVDISQLPNGVYILQLIKNNGDVITKKIFKKSW